MKNAQKKSKIHEIEEDERLNQKAERNQRRQHKNWTRVWMEHAHEAEEIDEFFR